MTVRPDGVSQTVTVKKDKQGSWGKRRKLAIFISMHRKILEQIIKWTSSYLVIKGKSTK